MSQRPRECAPDGDIRDNPSTDPGVAALTRATLALEACIDAGSAVTSQAPLIREQPAVAV
jgi:hypothetical protein